MMACSTSRKSGHFFLTPHIGGTMGSGRSWRRPFPSENQYRRRRRGRGCRQQNVIIISHVIIGHYRKRHSEKGVHGATRLALPGLCPSCQSSRGRQAGAQHDHDSMRRPERGPSSCRHTTIIVFLRYGSLKYRAVQRYCDHSVRTMFTKNMQTHIDNISSVCSHGACCNDMSQRLKLLC